MNPGQFAQIACVLEATARKPGNVHRGQDFADLSYVDFLLAAAAIAPVLDRAFGHRVGETILEAVQATRQVTSSNVNLGMILLFSPMATVPADSEFHPGLGKVLAGLDVQDSRLVYQAIRLARPGGLGTVSAQDIADEPTLPLREIMALAAGRDRIAKQYADGFRDVFAEGVPALQSFLSRSANLEEAIIGTHLQLLARIPDSLIARKLGLSEAEEASRRAAEVLELGWPESRPGQQAFKDLDGWLRAVGNQRNPGTTADLVAASLFVALRRGIITLPVHWPFTA